MISSDYTRSLLVPDGSGKIVLLVIDGLGGLPDPTTGMSELDTASLPNLDRLAQRGSCGLLSPLGPGFTPGSGPAHLALFGYDPWRWQIGRGALSALGLGMDFRAGDVAARLNFCTVDHDGRVTDRRAGRISTDESRSLCKVLHDIDLGEISFTLVPEMDYRVAIVLRGARMDAQVSASDPQKTGVMPQQVIAEQPAAERTAIAVRSFLQQAGERLFGQPKANMMLIRGFGTFPEIPGFSDVYGMRALAIAAHPMYRGVAKAVGMEVVACENEMSSSCELLRQHWEEFDFFFLHFKKTDSVGEDGNFAGKVRLLEMIDAHIPSIVEREPQVLIVTGDHSTPSLMESHSWHPVPVGIASSNALPHEGAGFSERGCLNGSVGTIRSTGMMALALAHCGRLQKYGA